MSTDTENDQDRESTQDPVITPAKRRSKLPYIVVTLVVLIVSLTMLTGLSGGRYSVEITDVLEATARYEGKDIKVVGRIKAGWTESSDGATTFFTIHDDKGSEIKVRYGHNRPDPFKEGRKCIVEGNLAEDGVIDCSKLTVKCPSKYQSENDFDNENSSFPSGSTSL